MNLACDVVIGSSVAARTLDEDISRAASSDARVLLLGESGTGKEVAAHLVHARSRRRGRPLAAMNCAGIPDTLLESELFGHVRGAFTGAYRDRPGQFEAANGGTMFLDEIGEMSLRMQAVLLRYLETGEVQRVGADQATHRVDVRIISATNRSLPERVADGRFREDLYYRLNVIPIRVPALRERREDVPDLAVFFRRRFAESHDLPEPAFDEDAIGFLQAHEWPGNIRELRNAVERMVVHAQGRTVHAADLEREVGRSSTPGVASALHEGVANATLADRVARDILEAMAAGQATFWTAVQLPFLEHDLTRDTVRRIVVLGLERSQGSYADLLHLFGMPSRDQRRFVSFLHKHSCLPGERSPGDKPVRPATVGAGEGTERW